MADTITENNNTQGSEQVPGNQQAPAANPAPRWLERLKKKFPDKDFTDEAAAKDEFYADYDKTHSDYDALKGDNAKIVELLQDNPEFAQVFAAVKDGMPLRVALARVIDFDAVRPQEDDPDYEAFTKSADEFKKRQADIAAHRKMIEENQSKSKVEIDDFFKGIGADDDEQVGFADFLQGVFDDVFNGKMGKEVLKKMWQAYKYTEDVEAAQQAGEVAGRNANIEVKREKAKATDGLPEAGGGINVSEPVKKPRNMVEEVAEKAERRRRLLGEE